MFLELVHLGLGSGKVWENRFVLYCMTLVDPYRKLLLTFNLRISREFRFIHFVYTARNSAKGLCKTASKFDKEISKNSRRIFHVLSNMQNDQ